MNEDVVRPSENLRLNVQIHRCVALTRQPVQQSVDLRHDGARVDIGGR